MITMYTGTPGSGKSAHAAKDIVEWLRDGKTVICNFPLNVQAVKGCRGKVLFWDNSELSAEKFISYGLEHNCGKKGRFGRPQEAQCLIVIDECQIIFNCREFGRKDRSDWVKFFSLHRHLFYDVLLITQSDRMVDKQIRSLVEYEIKHRKLNNCGFMGLLFMFTFHTWFGAYRFWYGGGNMKLDAEIFMFRKKYGQIYDSYGLFSGMLGADGAGDCAGGNREAVGPRGTAPAPDVTEKEDATVIHNPSLQRGS